LWLLGLIILETVEMSFRILAKSQAFQLLQVALLESVLYVLLIFVVVLQGNVNPAFL
jgi:hypothetical protein